MEKEQEFTCLFEELYFGTEKDIKDLNAPLIKRSVQRKLYSAWDDAEKKKLDAEAKILELRKDFKNYNINSILEQVHVMDKCNELQFEIEEEYEELFSEGMEVIDLD